MSTLDKSNFPAWFRGLKMQIVEPGTTIEHGPEKLVVNDQECVKRDRVLYCTERVSQALRAAAGVLG